MRLVTLLALLGLAVALVGSAAAFAAVAQKRAMTRCSATPPGFTRKLRRAEVTVEWKVFPFSYECRYVTRDDVVRRPPP